MGGTQSGTHTPGDALWIQERQKQKCQRGTDCYETHGNPEQHSSSTQDRRKLLKRTRSLAVISEDEARLNERERHNFSLCESSSFNLPRRPQLIPRAKLIHRNSLKDRLSKSQRHLSDSYEKFSDYKSYQSRSACAFNPTTSPFNLSTTLPNFSIPHVNRTSNRKNPDRLNILEDWPDPPRRYRSVQNLDTVSGLVDIVEDDNWPIEGNRSIDCIYTQVKRKRKEHRSLDSILFEDEGELEYFDVLNLLPLSNVRLEFNETDAKKNNNKESTFSKLLKRTPKNSAKKQSISSRFNDCLNIHENCRSNITDEEKCYQSHEETQQLNAHHDSSPILKESLNEKKSSLHYNKSTTNETLDTIDDDRKYRADVVLVTPCEEEPETNLADEAEDFKSIWISDTEEFEDMSRRPQVLKIVDNDVTKRRSWNSNSEKNYKDEVDSMNDGTGDGSSTKYLNFADGNIGNSIKEQMDDSKPREDSQEASPMRDDKDKHEDKDENTPVSVENARNFFEKITTNAPPASSTSNNNDNTENRFTKIVKDTTNIINKACNVVKEGFRFESRSESSDLGLGSETGSETTTTSKRRTSMDDGVDVTMDDKKSESRKDSEPRKKCNLIRSRSCVDAMESSNSNNSDSSNHGAEFDHVRYKIVKSNVFSRNMFGNARGDVTYEGLVQYLREYSFQELLLDNNVVIIEPVRAETIELRRNSPVNRERNGTNTCKITGAIEKINHDNDCQDFSEDHKRTKEMKNEDKKIPRQSSLRKHFFYHPIRVNRELIDEELPDPDTVKNVRRMFEDTLKKKKMFNSNDGNPNASNCRKCVSMKDLSKIEDDSLDSKNPSSRSRCSSRAKDLRKLFENIDKRTPKNSETKLHEPESPRSESKTRILAQSFENRSGQTSPSGMSNSWKNKLNHRYHHGELHNWDSGSVSSGVSSDYPDTDPGSNAHCTSSEDEELLEDEHSHIHENSNKKCGHYVSPDVLKKIREYGTSVTYYGGKVVSEYNGPPVSPFANKNNSKVRNWNKTKLQDYVKFRLVKSNSCDSRLELTGRLVQGNKNHERIKDLKECTIEETPSIEITCNDKIEEKCEKREPPVVIGLEPKRDDGGKTNFKAEFKLGKIDNSTLLNIHQNNHNNKFLPSALTRWQINDNNWTWKNSNFDKMEFEEFQVLEDSLNNTETS